MPETKPRANDPVRAYMTQMGQTKLLTKEEEVNIFKRIEQAQTKALSILYSNTSRTFLLFDQHIKEVIIIIIIINFKNKFVVQCTIQIFI